MIIEYVTRAMTAGILAVFSNLDDVTTLPFQLTDFIVSMMEYVYAFSEVFWPLKPIVVCVIWYLPFLALLMTIKFFLGSRAPNTA